MDYGFNKYHYAMVLVHIDLHVLNANLCNKETCGLLHFCFDLYFYYTCMKYINLFSSEVGDKKKCIWAVLIRCVEQVGHLVPFFYSKILTHLLNRSIKLLIVSHTIKFGSRKLEDKWEKYVFFRTCRTEDTKCSCPYFLVLIFNVTTIFALCYNHFCVSQCFVILTFH